MKRSPGSISKSDPSTVPAVDLTGVFSILFYVVCARNAVVNLTWPPRFSSPWLNSNRSYPWLPEQLSLESFQILISHRLVLFSPLVSPPQQLNTAAPAFGQWLFFHSRNPAPRLHQVHPSGELLKICSQGQALPVRFDLFREFSIGASIKWSFPFLRRHWGQSWCDWCHHFSSGAKFNASPPLRCSNLSILDFSGKMKWSGRILLTSPTSHTNMITGVPPKPTSIRAHLFGIIFNINLASSLLEQEEGGTEARQLTQRACKVRNEPKCLVLF